MYSSLISEIYFDNYQLLPDQFSLAENCKNSFQNQMLRMMQLVQINKVMSVFKYVSFNKFKVFNYRRQRSRGSHTRGMWQFFHIGYDTFKAVDIGDSSTISKSIPNKCPKPFCGIGYGMNHMVGCVKNVQ